MEIHTYGSDSAGNEVTLSLTRWGNYAVTKKTLGTTVFASRDLADAYARYALDPSPRTYEEFYRLRSEDD